MSTQPRDEILREHAQVAEPEERVHVLEVTAREAAARIRIPKTVAEVGVQSSDFRKRKAERRKL